MRARLIIASIVAAVGAFVGAGLVTRNGDTPAALAETERGLTAAFQPKVLLAREEPLKRGKVYTISDSAGGRRLDIELVTAPSENALEYLYAQVGASRALSRAEVSRSFDSYVGAITQIAPAFNDLSPLWSALVYQNQQTAKARAMSHYDSNPAEIESYVWLERA